jgi:ABC-type dipeptide/oligopeptide/nickel transport system permease subunit
MVMREQEYVMAARPVRAPGWCICTRYLLPNAILTESALSFLGLGVPPPNASLGKMLEEAQQFIRTSWWMWIVPGMAISMIVLAFNFVGDGLRDALDPRLRN